MTELGNLYLHPSESHLNPIWIGLILTRASRAQRLAQATIVQSKAVRLPKHKGSPYTQRIPKGFVLRKSLTHFETTKQQISTSKYSTHINAAKHMQHVYIQVLTVLPCLTQRLWESNVLRRVVRRPSHFIDLSCFQWRHCCRAAALEDRRIWATRPWLVQAHENACRRDLAWEGL